jgi:hypothetical protein
MISVLTRLFQCHKQWTLLSEHPYMPKFEAYSETVPGTDADECHGCAMCRLGLDLYPQPNTLYFSCQDAHRAGFDCPLNGYAWREPVPGFRFDMRCPCTIHDSSYMRWARVGISSRRKSERARAMVEAIEDCISDYLEEEL